ncbi:hypothetical protein GW17_00045287, partial [Ensete ventricosum]
GNSPGVRRKLAEGIRSLLGWHKGVRQKKTETRWKIVGDSRKAYREYQAKDWTMQWELAGSLLGDLPKGSGSSLSTCREIAGGRP